MESCYSYLPLALLGAPTTTTTTSTSSSQITNFRAPRAAQHGRFPSLLPAMPSRRLQLNRSPTYVSTRGTREGRLGRDRKESLTSASRGKTNLVSHQPTNQPTQLGAANTILCQKARSGQNLWLHTGIGSRNCRSAELPLYVCTANADRFYERR